jgi:DNA helicase IV
MLAEDHPQVEEEKDQLDKTLKYIHQKLDRRWGDGGSQREASREIAKMEKDDQQRLAQALQSAYFARVDIQEEDDEIAPYYVSKYGPFPEVNVFSWAAPKPLIINRDG